MKDIFNKVVELEKFVFNDENTGDIVLDKAYDLSVKKDLLAEKFEKILEENKVDGFFVTQDNGYHVSVTKSSKEQGKWQVTNFDNKMIPISDNGNQNIKDASESFFNSFTLSSLDEDSLIKLKDTINDEKKTYLNTDYDDLKLVRVVKDIDNFIIDENNLIVNQNPNKGESIRNTVHFTLNAVVKDHSSSKGIFSESKYAIVADLKETAENNKIHGLSPVDTYFWGENFKVKEPTIFMPKSDEKFNLYSKHFEVVEYEQGDSKEENYKNLNNAVENYFNKKELPFNEVGLWNWNNHGIISNEEQKDLSQYLGSAEILPYIHENSLDQKMENINSSLVVLAEYLSNVKSEDDFKNLPFSFGEEIDKDKKHFFELIEEIKEINPHSLDHYKLVENKLNILEEDWKEKIDLIYKEENINVAVPPPIPTDQEWKESLDKLSISTPPPIPFDEFCTNPQMNDLLNKHLNLTDENKEKRFFTDPEDALNFYKNNFKEIEHTIEMQASSSGYESKADFMKDNPYFSEYKKEDLDNVFNGNDSKELNNLYIELSNYTADTLNFDKDYFEDAQNNILENYSNGELYIFLSDESSQAIYVKDNMFMDDQDSEISGKLNQVFDKVEQVETLLEANEALIQDKINRINLMDNRKNPNVNTIKSIAQGKLNHIKGELSEIKPFNTQSLTPIGQDKENIIMLDSKNDNLYSISKNKIVASEKDIANILKDNKPIELFNNGDKIEIKGYNDSLKDKSKELKNSMEIN